MSRPEHQPPEVYYDAAEAKKYDVNPRIVEIQAEMTERALELLNLDYDKEHLVLDLGVGSGLSGEILTEYGQQWVGLDISPHMLNVAICKEDRLEGDLLYGDMGHLLPFRDATFDAAISISALQWLCYAARASHVPHRRLKVFFTSLYQCLSKAAKAVFQFYPESNEQIDMVTRAAMAAGFTGGIVVDYPESKKAKKIYLVLFTGATPQTALPAGLSTTSQDMHPVTKRYQDRQIAQRKLNAKRTLAGEKTKSYIDRKKARNQLQGKDVRPDSKYSGRKRRTRF